jgi:protein TonB
MPSRLILAFALSLALHASLLLPDVFSPRPPPPRSTLAASLRLPPGPQDHGSDDTLLKNTLLSEKAPLKAPPATPAVARAGPAPGKAATKRQLDAVQRKLAQHQYYPPEAIARGLEGEGSLLLTLAEDGSISEVSIAVSSGHPILDQAAVRAAYAMARVNWALSRELILPFIFRLE